MLFFFHSFIKFISYLPYRFFSLLTLFLAYQWYFDPFLIYARWSTSSSHMCVYVPYIWSECGCVVAAAGAVDDAYWIFNLEKFNFRIYLIAEITKCFSRKKKHTHTHTHTTLKKLMVTEKSAIKANEEEKKTSINIFFSTKNLSIRIFNFISYTSFIHGKKYPKTII